MNSEKLKKKGVEIAINTVIMLIIGMIIFGLGIGLFAKFSKSGTEQIKDLRSQIVKDISSLECSDSFWICIPSIKTRIGNQISGNIFITNNADSREIFKIDMMSPSPLEIEKNNCGKVNVYYGETEFEIESGDSLKVPIVITTGSVNKPCSFTKSISLLNSNDQVIEKTPLIINVE